MVHFLFIRSGKWETCVHSMDTAGFGAQGICNTLKLIKTKNTTVSRDNWVERRWIHCWWMWKNSIPLSTSCEVALLPSSDKTSKLWPSPPLLPPGHLAFKLSGPPPLITAIIYRPPKPHLSFCSDFADLLTQLFTISPSILLLGDFNFHLDRTDSEPAIAFLEVLQCLNLTQHINFATDENPETTARATALKTIDFLAYTDYLKHYKAAPNTAESTYYSHLI